MAPRNRAAAGLAGGGGQKAASGGCLCRAYTLGLFRWKPKATDFRKRSGKFWVQLSSVSSWASTPGVCQAGSNHRARRGLRTWLATSSGAAGKIYCMGHGDGGERGGTGQRREHVHPEQCLCPRCQSRPRTCEGPQRTDRRCHSQQEMPCPPLALQPPAPGTLLRMTKFHTHPMGVGAAATPRPLGSHYL